MKNKFMEKKTFIITYDTLYFYLLCSFLFYFSSMYALHKYLESRFFYQITLIENNFNEQIQILNEQLALLQKNYDVLEKNYNLLIANQAELQKLSTEIPKKHLYSFLTDPQFYVDLETFFFIAFMISLILGTGYLYFMSLKFILSPLAVKPMLYPDLLSFDCKDSISNFYKVDFNMLTQKCQIYIKPKGLDPTNTDYIPLDKFFSEHSNIFGNQGLMEAVKHIKLACKDGDLESINKILDCFFIDFSNNAALILAKNPELGDRIINTYFGGGS